jgi:hypothetical protein
MPLLAAVAVACVSPLAFGAVAGDGVGDEQAIAAAIASARTTNAAVCLPAGVFELARPAKWASLVIDGPVTLRGEGASTILRMTGDGRQGDWRGIELRAGAHGVIFEDLAIDSLGTYNTEEQTHLVQLSPGVSRVTFRRVQLGPMRHPGQSEGEGSGGDCLRLVGEAHAMVEDVVVSRSLFVDCDRSGVSLQRGLRRIVISRSTIRGTGDSPIDFEPTAPGPIEDVVMAGLSISRGPRAQGSWGIAIGGYGQDVATRITVANNVLEGGGVGMLNVGQVLVAQNEIRHGTGAGPTISVRRRAEQVLIQDNVIVRPSGAPAAALIEAQHNNGFAPESLVLVENRMQQATSAPVISTYSVARLEVRGNLIEYDGPDARQFVIDTHATAADVDHLVMTGNTIRGVARAALRLDARGRSVRGVKMRGNLSASVGASVACEAQATGRFGKVEEEGNDFGGAAAECAQVPTLAPASARASARMRARAKRRAAKTAPPPLPVDPGPKTAPQVDPGPRPSAAGASRPPSPSPP